MSDRERRRVQAAFDGYRRSARKQRSWSPEQPGNRAMRAEVTAEALRAIGPAPASPLLDVGCGTGWWLRHLRERGREPGSLLGVDVQARRVEQARLAVPGARIEVADARRLPFADGCVAVVTMLLLLSSLRDRDAMVAALEQGLRVLQPGGLLLIWDVRVANPANRATVTPPWRRLAGAAGEPVALRPITLNPWLARRLGRRTASAYPILARVPGLRTHRLLLLRKP